MEQFRGGGYHGTTKQVGVLPSRLRPSSTGRSAGETEDLGRVLCEHAIPPQVRPAAAEWAAARSGAAPTAPPSAAAPHLWSGASVGAEGNLEAGGVSLVGAAEGADPLVDALGAEAFSTARGAMSQLLNRRAKRCDRKSRWSSV